MIAEQFNSALEAQNHSGNPSEDASYCNGDYSEVEAKFGEALKSTRANIMDVLQKLSSLSNDHVPSEKSFGSVTSWESILKSSVGSLSLDKLNDQLLEIVSCAVGYRISEIFLSLRISCAM